MPSEPAPAVRARATRLALLVATVAYVAPTSALGQADEVETYLAPMRYATESKPDLVLKALPMLAAATARVSLDYNDDCQARIRAAVGAGDAAQTLREARRLIALDMRWQLDRCAAEPNRARCDAVLTQGALRYALLTRHISEESPETDKRVRRSSQRVERMLRKASPYAREAPLDEAVIKKAMRAIWTETSRALQLSEALPQ